MTRTEHVGLLLTCLNGVRPCRKGWVARCPSHADRSASLSIAEADDGRILLHCFAGCATSDVLAAVELSLTDLFPKRIQDDSPHGRAAARHYARESNRTAAIGVLMMESTVIEVAAEMILRGEPMTPEDVDRVHLASNRIHDAREVLHGR